MSSEVLDHLFYPQSIALAGISIDNPEHWTRTFLDSLLEFRYEGPVYPINPKGGEIDGLKVYRSLEDVPNNIDYVISTLPAILAPRLIEDCARKRAKVIHFCTAGFSETGENAGKKLEAELTELSRLKGIRIVGPNCMGVYCPESRVSFDTDFPKQSGSVAFVSQSGGNTTHLIRQAMWRGVRFSKVVSYGNACDLDESDFLEYLTADPATKVIAMYVEGIKDGQRFRQALDGATREKKVVLLKGGITGAGARAVTGHTGTLAGSEVAWEALCKQLRVVQVHSVEELADVVVTLSFMPLPKGRNAVILGGGGGASVLISDEFEKRGLKVPPLSKQIADEIREFSPVAGNILRNPIDYSQTIMDSNKLVKTVNILSQWEQMDFLILYLRPSEPPPRVRGQIFKVVNKMLESIKNSPKPVAMVIESSMIPNDMAQIFPLVQKFVECQIPVYYSFAGAAQAISLVLRDKKGDCR